MENKKQFIISLGNLIKCAEDIEGRWSGEEAGHQEENAHTSREIIQHCKEIINLIETLK